MNKYLDNAATSWPKPESVYKAVDHFMREIGGTPGRGGHWQEKESARIADQTRAAIAELFHAPDPDGVVFTMNATQAINMALKGLLESGDHVITSSIEHNAMWRPLKALEQRRVEVTAVQSLFPATPAVLPHKQLLLRKHGQSG
jgi:selenocysteine lyase/cysteine desulfurase